MWTWCLLSVEKAKVHEDLLFLIFMTFKRPMTLWIELWNVLLKYGVLYFG